MTDFTAEVNARISANADDSALQAGAQAFLLASINARYSYNFSWLGRPVIQYPQDLVAMQEIIWRVKPDLVIETGIAHGGSLIMSASMLALIDYCDAVEQGRPLDPRASARRVLAIDVDIRAHNRAAIEAHPLSHKIDMLQGSSIDPAVVADVKRRAAGHERVLVFLDSNHTHDHVLGELQAYAPLASRDSYCVVFDTVIEDLPEDAFTDRPWGRGNNAKTAVREYLRALDSAQHVGADGAPLRFAIDEALEHKLMVTVAPGGYLKRV